MDFSKVQLKKTIVKQKPTSNVVLCADSESYHQLMNETYLEQYIDAIKPWTFASTFIPLSKHTAQEIVNEHSKYVAKNTPAARDDWKANQDLQTLASLIDGVMLSMVWQLVA